MGWGEDLLPRGLAPKQTSGLLQLVAVVGDLNSSPLCKWPHGMAAGFLQDRWFRRATQSCHIFGDQTSDMTHHYLYSILLATQIHLISCGKALWRAWIQGVRTEAIRRLPATGLFASLCLKIFSLDNFWGLFWPQYFTGIISMDIHVLTGIPVFVITVVH